MDALAIAIPKGIHREFSRTCSNRGGVTRQNEDAANLKEAAEKDFAKIQPHLTDDCAKKYDGCCTVECQTVYNLPLEEQVELRKGMDKGMMVFNKSKKRLRPKLNSTKII